MNIVFTLRYSYSPQAFDDNFTREFSPEAHKGKSENDWWVSKIRIATFVFIIARTLFLFSLFTYYINHTYRSFLLHFFTLISRKIKLEFLFYSLGDPLSRTNTFSLTSRPAYYQSIRIHIYFYSAHASIYILLQFLTRLNSNLPLIVTHDRAKRSGSAPSNEYISINVSRVRIRRSSLPRAETWNVTYSNTSLDTHAHLDRSKML